MALSIQSVWDRIVWRERMDVGARFDQIGFLFALGGFRSAPAER